MIVICTIHGCFDTVFTYTPLVPHPALMPVWLCAHWCICIWMCCINSVHYHAWVLVGLWCTIAWWFALFAKGFSIIYSSVSALLLCITLPWFTCASDLKGCFHCMVACFLLSDPIHNNVVSDDCSALLSSLVWLFYYNYTRLLTIQRCFSSKAVRYFSSNARLGSYDDTMGLYSYYCSIFLWIMVCAL